MKKIILVILVSLIIAGCSSKAPEPVTTTTLEPIVKFALVPSSEGIEVVNKGTSLGATFNLSYRVNWFIMEGDEPKETSQEFMKGFKAPLNPGERVMLTNLGSCLPTSQKGKYSIYKCLIVLSSNGATLDESTVFMSYAQGQNPWEDDFQQIDESDYESVRDYLTGKI